MGRLLQYSHGTGYGIGLYWPTQWIDVGDVYYWGPDRKANRILNIFDNKRVPRDELRRHTNIALVA